MQNDPAILLYTKDLLMAFTPMTMHARGQLMTLLLLQHQLGHLSLEQIETSVGEVTPALMAHFACAADGRFFNPRVEAEILRRSAYREKQQQKARKRWDRPGQPGADYAEQQSAVSQSDKQVSSTPHTDRGNAAGYAEGMPIEPGTGAGTEAGAGTGAGEGEDGGRQIGAPAMSSRACRGISQVICLSGGDPSTPLRSAQDDRGKNAPVTAAPLRSVQDDEGETRSRQGMAPYGEQGDLARRAGPDRERQREAFERFWAAYPRKIGRKGAAELFAKLPETLWPRLLEAVERQKGSEQWRREGGRYIPSPITWLSQERWDDLPEPEPNREALWTVADMVRDIERAFGPIEAAPKPGDSRQQEGCV